MAKTSKTILKEKLLNHQKKLDSQFPRKVGNFDLQFSKNDSQFENHEALFHILLIIIIFLPSLLVLMFFDNVEAKKYFEQYWASNFTCYDEM